MFAGIEDGSIDQIADDLFHIAPNITYFGELCGFDLDKRRTCQLSQTARNFCLTDASGTDHQDVLWVYFIPEIVAQLLAAPTVAQSYSNSALGIVLTNDKAVQFRYDFTGG